jgi:hypothetical protein
MFVSYGLSRSQFVSVYESQNKLHSLSYFPPFILTRSTMLDAARPSAPALTAKGRLVTIRC